jgi:hypothetical protein
MSVNVLDKLRSSVDELLASPSLLHARQAVDLARLAWAHVYDATLVSGDYPAARLELFRQSLCDCLMGLGKVPAEPQVRQFSKRIVWYRGLLETLTTRGIGAVTAAIEQTIASLQSTGEFTPRAV